MAVVIRLQRIGKPKQAYFRVVAIEKTRGPRGKPLEILGSYNPRADKAKEKIVVDQAALERWLHNGAKASETVASLVRQSGKGR